MIIADLHIHSRYSRATSNNLTVEHLWLTAQRKGIDILGTGDFTHSKWLAELKEKLYPTDDGAYELRSDLAINLNQQIVASCRRPIRFLLSGEISCIYKRGGRVRKVHNLILMPNFATVERLNMRLSRLGNINSDGRPILGLDSRDLLELCLEIEPNVIFIPAHIWTPWFSLFGSNSGFDAIEECFDDLTRYIQALETGLSSDPSMNWRLRSLDRFTLVSNSDAHSLSNLGREANLLDCEPNYLALVHTLANRQSKKFVGTLEFFPAEGKYYLDGHRKCGVRLTPAETQALRKRCPVCGDFLTIGVLNRVEELADRPIGNRPEAARFYESLIPLNVILGEIMQRGVSSKSVVATIEKLIIKLGPEFYILRQAPLADLKKVGGSLLAEAIRRMRVGEVWIEGGFDGQFGTVRLFNLTECYKLKMQDNLWINLEERKGQTLFASFTNTVKLDTNMPLVLNYNNVNNSVNSFLKILNPIQVQAVQHRGKPLIIRAGPGTGKTHVLVEKTLLLIKKNIDPNQIAMIAFTRKAAAELRKRLTNSSSKAKAIYIGTFHSLGLEILTQVLGKPPVVIDENARLALIAPLAKKFDLKVQDLAQKLSYYKQQLPLPIESNSIAWLIAYQEVLDQKGFFDLDDLILEAVLYLRSEKQLAQIWSSRFKYILVDEYQDVNSLQVDLLLCLYGPEAEITVIGDPDQAIYGFRGSDRSLFLSFSSYFPDAVEISLVDNYRSRPSILALAEAVLAEDPDVKRVALQSQLSEKTACLPVLCELPSIEAEAEWVAGKIVALLGGLDSRQVEFISNNRPVNYVASDIAILYRLHAQSFILQEVLERSGVPIQIAAQEPLAETDTLDFKTQRVSLLTMHAAKGLEFSIVFVVGLEDNILPYQFPQSSLSNLNEERRLLYVALTRARERLYLSRACKRLLYGKTMQSKLTPFLLNLDRSLFIYEKQKTFRRQVYQLKLFTRIN